MNEFQGGMFEVLAQGMADSIALARYKKQRARQTWSEIRAAFASDRTSRKTRKQHRRATQIMRRQMTRVSAGFATEAEAVAALRGRGGPENPLDRRRF
jgi:hypothetical protein